MLCLLSWKVAVGARLEDTKGTRQSLVRELHRAENTKGRYTSTTERWLLLTPRQWWTRGSCHTHAPRTRSPWGGWWSVWTNTCRTRPGHTSYSGAERHRRMSTCGQLWLATGTAEYSCNDYYLWSICSLVVNLSINMQLFWSLIHLLDNSLMFPAC